MRALAGRGLCLSSVSETVVDLLKCRHWSDGDCACHQCLRLLLTCCSAGIGRTGTVLVISL